ncbi:hypothetical protein SNEBB_004408 [Seison nebaliae]|nr:hypothetical protein SNEBB_004408 [Seison nebaliae]
MTTRDKLNDNISIKRQNIRTLSLIICTFTYLLIGAAVFDRLESSREQSDYNRYKNVTKQIKEKYNVTENDMQQLINTFWRKKKMMAGSQWQFPGAFFYCLIVTSLIGYGHSTPVTFSGKIFTIIYAIVGIPISIIMFQSVGERINTFLAHIMMVTKQKYYSYQYYQLKRHVKNEQKRFGHLTKTSLEQSEKLIQLKMKAKTQQITQMEIILAEFCLSMFTVFSAAAIFHYKENWSYFEAVYYCFITLTTIGFGDYVPMQKKEMLNRSPAYYAFTVLFIVSVLTFGASSINLLVLKLVSINTEEERKEKLQLEEAIRQQVTVKGDVISENTRIVIKDKEEKPEEEDLVSVCSCEYQSCFRFQFSKSQKSILNRCCCANCVPSNVNDVKNRRQLKNSSQNRDDDSSQIKKEVVRSFGDSYTPCYLTTDYRHFYKHDVHIDVGAENAASRQSSMMTQQLFFMKKMPIVNLISSNDSKYYLSHSLLLQPNDCKSKDVDVECSTIHPVAVAIEHKNLPGSVSLLNSLRTSHLKDIQTSNLTNFDLYNLFTYEQKTQQWNELKKKRLQRRRHDSI